MLRLQSPKAVVSNREGRHSKAGRSDYPKSFKRSSKLYRSHSLCRYSRCRCDLCLRSFNSCSDLCCNGRNS
jgi:hypothetical protein